MSSKNYHGTLFKYRWWYGPYGHVMQSVFNLCVLISDHQSSTVHVAYLGQEMRISAGGRAKVWWEPRPFVGSPDKKGPILL